MRGTLYINYSLGEQEPQVMKIEKNECRKLVTERVNDLVSDQDETETTGHQQTPGRNYHF